MNKVKIEAKIPKVYNDGHFTIKFNEDIIAIQNYSIYNSTGIMEVSLFSQKYDSTKHNLI